MRQYIKALTRVTGGPSVQGGLVVQVVRVVRVVRVFSMVQVVRVVIVVQLTH